MNQKKGSNKVREVTWPVGPQVDPLISNTDPQGWYTGRPEERYEIPVQDADDL